MQIQINTDHSIEGHQALASHLSGVIENALSPLLERITHIEVHLSDENGPGNDGKQMAKRCLLEARVKGCRPLAVTAHADTVHQSVIAAADKLARLIDSTLGRLHDHKHRRDALTLDDETPPEELPLGSVPP